MNVTEATLTAPPCWDAKGGRRMLLKKTLLALPRALQTKVRLEAGQSAPDWQLDSEATERTAAS